MKQNLGLSQRLTQRMELTITPQMVQQMNLLVKPLLDFNAEIETLADGNPALEMVRPADAPADTKTSDAEDQKSNDEWDERAMQRIAELGEEPHAGSGSWAGGTSRPDEDWTDPMQRVSAAKTLTEDLLEQVRLTFSGLDGKIGEFLVQDLDSRGFLTRSFSDLATDISAYAGAPVSEERVVRIVDHLKANIDPPGLLASTVEESIELQLRRRNKSKWVDLIVKGYQLLRAGKERELVRLCNREGVDTKFVLEELEKLTFVPTFGTQDQHFDANSVRPEVTITRAHPDRYGPDKYEVHYNNQSVVNLRLNPKVIRMAQRRDQLSAEERKLLKEKVDQAKWLKQVIDERRSLLLNATQILVNRQWEFLDRGRRYLKPLTRREVAEQVNRDESTISRLLNGRFADTPQGCLPLSAFFSQAVGHASGAAAREVLREIMDAERVGDAYTDDDLAELMRRKGFAIQRRTVNKYRRMLGGYYALKRSVRRTLNRASQAG